MVQQDFSIGSLLKNVAFALLFFLYFCLKKSIDRLIQKLLPLNLCRYPAQSLTGSFRFNNCCWFQSIMAKHKAILKTFGWFPILILKNTQKNSNSQIDLNGISFVSDLKRQPWIKWDIFLKHQFSNSNQISIDSHRPFIWFLSYFKNN